MTGIVLTISLIAAFQGDAAVPVVTGAAYIAHVQRSTAGIERFRIVIPGMQSRKSANVRMAMAPVFLFSLPAQNQEWEPLFLPTDCRRIPSAIRSSSPIRGPDSYAMLA